MVIKKLPLTNEDMGEATTVIGEKHGCGGRNSASLYFVKRKVFSGKGRITK